GGWATTPSGSSVCATTTGTGWLSTRNIVINFTCMPDRWIPDRILVRREESDASVGLNGTGALAPTGRSLIGPPEASHDPGSRSVRQAAPVPTNRPVSGVRPSPGA